MASVTRDLGQLPVEGSSGKWVLEICLSPSTGEPYFLRTSVDVNIPKVGSVQHRAVNTRLTPAQVASLKSLAAAALAALVERDPQGNVI